MHRAIIIMIIYKLLLFKTLYFQPVFISYNNMIFVVYLFYRRELPIVIGSSIHTWTPFDNLSPSLVENN